MIVRPRRGYRMSIFKLLQCGWISCFACGVLLAQNDWPSYGKDGAGQRHSPLTQINTSNVKKLKLAWQYGIDAKSVSMDNATRLLTSTEAVPIMVNGILYS